MKKSDLIDRIALETGMSKAKARKAVDAFGDVLKEVGSCGDTLTLQGVGTFKGKTRPDRTARNPATGEAVTVPAKKVLRFKMSSGLEL